MYGALGIFYYYAMSSEESVSESSRCGVRIVTTMILAILAMEIVIILMLTGVIRTPVGSTKMENISIVSKSQPTSTTLKTTIVKSYYGTTNDGTDIYKFSFTNSQNTKLEVITFGAIITSLNVSDRYGNIDDVVLGYTNIRDYEVNTPHFGGIAGRVANRIANATFTLDGISYKLAKNNNGNSLHGGIIGFDKRPWSYVLHEDHLALTLRSPDGQEGFPGDLEVTVQYWLTDANEVVIKYQAHVHKKATPINLTSHAYFNLAGEGKGRIDDHEVQINADQYLENDQYLIPTGNFLPVSGDLDLRNMTRLGDVISHVMFDGQRDGFDHAFSLPNPTGVRFAARVHEPSSGRVLEVYTDQPSLQFYTSNFLNTTGKHPYSPQTAFCMETQNYPDAVNHDNFPESVLRPDGSTYRQLCVYKFYTK